LGAPGLGFAQNVILSNLDGIGTQNDMCADFTDTTPVYGELRPKEKGENADIPEVSTGF
jgi:hypothetical protein